MPNNSQKRDDRASIFHTKKTKDEIKEIATSNKRTIVGQVEYWLEKEKNDLKRQS